MDPKAPLYDQIVQMLGEKAPLKMDVIHNLERVFGNLRTVCRNLEKELTASLEKVDKRITVKVSERGSSDIEFRFCDDVIIFSMHTDAYIFPESHQMWKNTYVSDDRSRTYCGMISIYNFLTGSLKYNRINDQGVLIGRIFVNRENHYFVEGKKQLGIGFNNFESDELNEQHLRGIVETAILHCLEIDIVTPSFDQVRVISVQELLEKNLANVVSTGKRLGFRLQSDSDLIQ
jgi:hypothetical protein